MALIRINEIIDRLKSYYPQADVAVVEKAYVWSAKLHAGSMRKSGLPYLSHPLEVAGVLTELKLRECAIAAGLLHDVIEDTIVTLDELEAEFGKEIARLVDGVTKIGRIAGGVSRLEAQAEYLRKMILATSQDVRVILIKLADRLHNMRTLEFLEEEKRIAIAQETLDIFAPVAGRLGIHWIQAQLEDLCLQHLKPEIFYRLTTQVATTRKARQEYVERVQTILVQTLHDAGIEANVKGRFKHLYSIYQKMQRRQAPFEEVNDLVAFRILVGTINECYDAFREIHSLWTPVPGRVKDYIALAKPNMYRSLHTTVIGPEGERVEVQIRTHEMHAIAEFGIAAHWRYKEVGDAAPPSEVEEKTLEFLTHLVEYQEDVKDPRLFLETVKSEISPEEIVLFTPAGDLIELPLNATPIDFAYAIHSDLGSHCGGAKVNGRFVPLDHTLKSGDTVEIVTSKTIEPTKAWLDIVKSQRALAKIKSHLSLRETEQVRELGRRIVEAELLKHNLHLGKLLDDGTMNHVAWRFSFPNPSRLFEIIGFGKFPVRKVLIALVPPEELSRKKAAAKIATGKKTKGAKSKAAKTKTTKTKKAARGKAKKPPAPLSPPADATGEDSYPPNPDAAIVIKDLGDPILARAACCGPIAGDDVIAVRDDRGKITVHRARCKQAADAHPERIIPARWAEKIDGQAEAVLEIVSADQKGMLVKISSAIADANLNIVRAVAHSTEDKKSFLAFTVTVKRLKQLQKLIAEIEKIDGVISVARI